MAELRPPAVPETRPPVPGESRISWLSLLDRPFQATQTTVGAAGGASALPATPSGYTVVKIGGTEFVVPYYKKS